MPQVDQRRFTA